MGRSEGEADALCAVWQGGSRGLEESRSWCCSLQGQLGEQGTLMEGTKRQKELALWEWWVPGLGECHAEDPRHTG